MKRKFTLILGLMLSMMTFAQKTVAVYVTASDGVPQETKRILGSELVAAITRNANYVAIERTDEFLSQVSQEQGRYNNIDDKKLFELGQKYGASNVCVAEITKFGNEYYIVSRLLDIRTQKVWKTARKSSELKSLGELMSVSEAVADELMGNTKEFSTYAYGDNSSNQSFITKIENRDNYTKVTFKYVSYSPAQRIGIQRNTYIEDVVTHEKYGLKDAANINIMYGSNNNYKTIGKGIWEYSLFFDRISEDTKNIVIIEPNGWAYKDIVLKPYGDENTFVFDDKTESLYKEMTKQYSGELQLNEGRYLGEIYDGKPDGRGIIYFKANDAEGRIRYEGQWKQGVMKGSGILTFKNARYEGEMDKNLPNGYGIYWRSDGSRVECTFHDGIPNGHAVVYSSGMKTECNVINGEMNGDFISYSDNGEIATGTMIDGQPNGTIVIKEKNGKVKKANFVKGKQMTDWF